MAFKGDTFIEVASCLARTDPNHQPSFYEALEVVKRYCRSKIAKGKGRQFVSKGGKLEDLERKYAHLGYQDIFYLARLHLHFPPSTLSLPRPTSPTRRVLIKAKYPLPLEVEAGDGDDEEAAAAAADPFSSPERFRLAPTPPRNGESARVQLGGQRAVGETAIALGTSESRERTREPSIVSVRGRHRPPAADLVSTSLTPSHSFRHPTSLAPPSSWHDPALDARTPNIQVRRTSSLERLALPSQLPTSPSGSDVVQSFALGVPESQTMTHSHSAPAITPFRPSPDAFLEQGQGHGHGQAYGQAFSDHLVPRRQVSNYFSSRRLAPSSSASSITTSGGTSPISPFSSVDTPLTPLSSMRAPAGKGQVYEDQQYVNNGPLHSPTSPSTSPGESHTHTHTRFSPSPPHSDRRARARAQYTPSSGRLTLAIPPGPGVGVGMGMTKSTSSTSASTDQREQEDDLIRQFDLAGFGDSTTYAHSATTTTAAKRTPQSMRSYLVRSPSLNTGRGTPTPPPRYEAPAAPEV